MAENSIAFTSASDMFDRLAQTLKTVAVTGMVKAAGDDGGSIHFSLRGCGTWVSVPAGIIEGYQPLGRTRCGDHQHDLVCLHIKRPQDDAGAALAGLLSLHHSALNWTHVGGAIAGIGGPGCPAGTYWDAANGGCVPI